jgi:hypothetical protein
MGTSSGIFGLAAREPGMRRVPTQANIPFSTDDNCVGGMQLFGHRLLICNWRPTEDPFKLFVAMSACRKVLG